MKSIKVRNYRVITLSLLLGLSLVGLSLMLARPPVVKAATTIVTSGADSGPGTLRQAIADAAPGDTITFSIACAQCSSFTINLTSGMLVIDKNLTINGPGANLLTVQRSHDSNTPFFPIFLIAFGPRFNVNISGLTIANGSDSGFFNGGVGCGITNENFGVLTVTACAISDNHSTAGTGGSGAGGIYSGGTLILTNSTISGNTASVAEAGGIYNAAGPATITNSTISGNRASSAGGIYNSSGGEYHQQHHLRKPCKQRRRHLQQQWR
jgi:hypothetical protein